MHSKIVFGTIDNGIQSSDMNDILHSSNRPFCVVGPNPATFRSSQVVNYVFQYYSYRDDANDNIGVVNVNDNRYTGNYIISTCVAYHPNDWADGPNTTSSKSLFEYLSPKFVKDLQNRKAMLLIDQSVEGYSVPWLWEWFHNKCELYNIDPASIMYFTGDQSCTDNYDRWCSANSVTTKLNVFPSITLGMYIRLHYERNHLNINFDELLEYKSSNKDSISLFDSTNMRPRLQRILNFLTLFNEGLLDYGNISMPKKSDWGSMGMVHPQMLASHRLPANIIDLLEDKQYFARHSHDNNTEHYWVFVERILHDLYRNSWVSLISESSYFEREYAVFISEKTFKPIASLQPFIIVGSKDSLKYLRKMGYKTFHPYIDESYDDLPDEQRFKAVAEALKKIQNIEDKASWYNSMRDILEHNQRLFLSITKDEPSEWAAIKSCYFNYFKENV